MTSAVLEHRPSDSDAERDRPVTAWVTGGLDGAMKIATMLRGRRYRVRSLAFDACDGDVSRVSCTVELSAPEVSLLVERLRRVPAVVSAEHAGPESVDHTK